MTCSNFDSLTEALNNYLKVKWITVSDMHPITVNLYNDYGIKAEYGIINEHDDGYGTFGLYAVEVKNDELATLFKLKYG